MKNIFLFVALLALGAYACQKESLSASEFQLSGLNLGVSDRGGDSLHQDSACGHHHHHNLDSLWHHPHDSLHPHLDSLWHHHLDSLGHPPHDSTWTPGGHHGGGHGGHGGHGGGHGGGHHGG